MIEHQEHPMDGIIKILCLLSLIIGACLPMGLASTPPATPPSKEVFISHLLAQMTLQEKIGQLRMNFPDLNAPEPNILQSIAAGKTGAIIGVGSRPVSRALQDVAVKQSRLKIPLFFGYDVIHGQRTIFPINLGMAASWDLKAMALSGRIAAQEASADGVDMTFAPMVDINRDPRWGRVSEGSGEDPYLASRISEVMVKAFQGTSPSARDSIMACVKHFALYGAAEGGRDYNSVDMSVVRMYQDYLPPYRAAVDAGAGAVMVAYNSINGLPATANAWLLHGVLRNEWGFKGLTLSDDIGVDNLIAHGVARNEREAARLAITAGTEMSMNDSPYGENLAALRTSGDVPLQDIDNAVRDVLGTKYDMGLFDNPYRRIGTADDDPVDVNAESRLHREQARDVARKSLVLLKNQNGTLPLKKQGTVALIGPLANSAEDILGAWSANGQASQAVTVYEGLTRALHNKATLIYAPGTPITTDAEVTAYLRRAFGEIEARPAAVMLDEALAVARRADVVVVVVGEARGMTGEAASRSSLDLPDNQRELITALKSVGKPLVLVLMNGRPLSIGREQDQADAVLETWFSGTEGGNAIADVLFGDYNPSGKLPITFPRSVGQIPTYYNHLNTGRPFIAGKPPYNTSQYFDAINSPLYPFGYGLSYTEFSLSDITLSATTLKGSAILDASITVKNIGQREGETVVQLYIRDVRASISRPVKELKNFQKIMLKAGEEKTVHFTISRNDLKFYNSQLKYDSEPGLFNVQIGLDSQEVKQQSFEVL
jgi:beta-glucosidase